VVHVLAVESTKYAESIARGDVSILAGCVCKRCGGEELELTNSWVGRGFQQKAGDYCQIDVVLARCLKPDCRTRERVLPCDVLPGKVNSVSNIYGALHAVNSESTLTDAAKRAGVTRQAIRKWIDGVVCRYLDLGCLLRHRAMLATAEAVSFSVLVNFWAFIERARTECPEYRWPISPSVVQSPHAVTQAQGSVMTLLENAGGALCVAALGALLFRQAVLLFRSGGMNTPSCVADDGDFKHDECPPKGLHHGEKENTGCEKCGVLALRTGRRCFGRQPHSRATRPNSSQYQQDSRSLALWQDKAHPTSYGLSMDSRLPTRRNRGPPTKTSVRSWCIPGEPARYCCPRGSPFIDRGPGAYLYLSLGASAAFVPECPHTPLHFA
jgi:hypothetical protein